MRLFLLIGLTGIVAQCAWFHAGIKGGLTLTPDLARDFGVGRSGGGESSTRVNRGTIGPYVEFTPFCSLPGFETGFFYRRLRTDSYFGPFPNAALNYITRTASLVEIPLLLKWRYRGAFAAAGSTIRRAGDYEQNYRLVPQFPGFSTTETKTPVANENRILYGATISAGYSQAFARIRLEPEIRFTRWTAVRDVPRQNQVDLLLGIRF